MNHQLIEKIDAILPQTQCKKCGFAGCLPYAEAIEQRRADINQCPPGGEEGIQKLAQLMGVKPKPLNLSHGFPKPRTVARIDERTCIGCTFCLQACPVDAIVGAAKQLHTVISAECTGCDLCIAPCPMDCISLVPIDEKVSDLSALSVEAVKKQAVDNARSRYKFKQQRLERDKQFKRVPLRQKNIVLPEIGEIEREARKKAIVQAAIKRAMTIRTKAAEINSSIKTHECS